MIIITSKRTNCRGFSLLEVMVAIGIIALLASLTIGLSNSIARRAEVKQTEDTLRLLKVALKEWEIEKGNVLTFEDYTYVGNCVECYFEVYNDDLLFAPSFGLSGVADDIMLEAMKKRICRTLTAIREIESSDNILLEIGGDNFEKYRDEDDPPGIIRDIVLDAWGTPIGVIFPGQYFANTSEIMFAEDASGDLTIRDEAEDALGSCINKRPIFVSAGPDRLWGYRFQAVPEIGSDEEAIALRQASRDNIYSYDPFIVEKAQ